VVGLTFPGATLWLQLAMGLAHYVVTTILITWRVAMGHGSHEVCLSF
jgi:hypothetical protein